MKYFIKTYGCQMNINDSEKIKGILQTQGYEPATKEEEADLVILNTCTIREKPDQKVWSHLGEIKRLKSKNPNVKIGVCGCMAQRAGYEIASKMPFVDMVFGTKNIHRIPNLLEELRLGNRAIEILEQEDPLEEMLDSYPTIRDNSYCAYVTIMRGCDKECTYCVVPFTRGKERSRAPQSIINEVKSLVDSGVMEIHLIGQNVTAYGKDIGYPFYKLLEDISKIEGVKRIRFTTGHPKDLTDEIIDAMAELPNMVNHIHLPFQAGSDRILELMKRNYTKAYYLNRIERLKAKMKDMSFSTDIIIGFPTETEEDFEHTLDVIKTVEFEQVFSFKYSKRPNTPAYYMEDELTDEVKTDRMKRLLEIQKAITSKLMKRYENTIQKVLIEDRKDNIYLGRTTSNVWCNVISDQDIMGKEVEVFITKSGFQSLEGVLKNVL
ncbi:tRNA (N6-isopentenyl adenosine(37)-C2)-methylthiotransferase MiaB [Hydrogenobaculum acidophilum]